ncbi:MAG: J domain-containing protein [Pseudomonadota bacterium]
MAGSGGSIWEILGVARDADRATIRKAYAEKLKTIDADADPKGFMALRDAYEAAIDYLRYADYEPVFPEDGVAPEDVGLVPDDSTDGDDVSDAGDQSEPGPAALSNPEDAGLAPDAADAESDPVEQGIGLYYAIADILETEDMINGGYATEGLSEEEEFDLRHKARDFWDWLEQQPVSMAARFEDPMANLLAQTVPRSDTLIEKAVQFFGWNSATEQWDQSDAIAHLRNRAGIITIARELAQPDDPLHAAWEDITTAGPINMNVRRKDMKALFRLTGKQYPQLSGYFDADKYDHWRLRVGPVEAASHETQGPKGKAWIVFAIIGVFLLAGRVTSFMSADLPNAAGDMPLLSPPAPFEVTIDSSDETVISRALERVYSPGLTRVEVQQDNPPLYADLEQALAGVRESDGDFDAYVKEVVRLASDHYDYAVEYGDAAFYRDHLSLEIDLLQHYYDARRCADFLDDDIPPDKLPTEFSDRRRELAARGVREVVEDEANIAFTLSERDNAELLRRISSKINRPVSDFLRDVRGERGGRAQCIARIHSMTVLRDWRSDAR